MTYVEYSNYKSFLGRVIVNRTLAADLKLQLESLIATQKSNYLSGILSSTWKTNSATWYIKKKT